MTTTYHRPRTLDEALTLLTRPDTVPLGGGTLLSRPTTDPIEVVDLQSLGLDTVKKNGNNLEIGATVTLQALLEYEHTPEAMKTALKLEASLNIRNSATVAGTLVACDGRSTFAVSFLALDAKVEIKAFEHRDLKDQSLRKTPNLNEQLINLGDFLPLRPHGLITSITIPLNVKLAFEYVSRTPADKPIVCAALAKWNSGRTRLALGGYGKSPILGMDGTEAEGLETAARNAFHEATDDYASAEFRMDVASTLAKRCDEKLAA